MGGAGVPARPPAFLLPLLFPLSLLYGAIVRLHRALYSSGILRKRRLPRPVVSVGNLTAGGGGKTPLVIWLAEQISASGATPGILSRGYGRRDSEDRLVRPGDPWQAVGDEPALIARTLRGTPVAVASRRYRGGRMILERGDVGLFILDDGFQHRGLHRDLDIVVVDNVRRFGNGLLLPAGPLREPLSRLADADLVVVTRSPGRDEGFERLLGRYTEAPVLWTDHLPVGLVPVDGSGGSPPDPPTAGPFVAFCGIAGPEGFRRSLEETGAVVAGMVTFPDHHPYSVRDLERIAELAVQQGARALVTTEKDAVRLPEGSGPLPCYTLAVRIQVHGGGERLLEPVLQLLGDEAVGRG